MFSSAALSFGNVFIISLAGNDVFPQCAATAQWVTSTPAYLISFFEFGGRRRISMRILQDLFEDEKATSASVLKCKHNQGGWKAFALM